MSKMHAMAHSRQRAVHTQSAGLYGAAATNKAALKSHWMSTIKGGSSVDGFGSDSD